MSDVYIPGVSSRFNTDQLIESLMRVERLPKDRAEKNVEDLQTQKTYWQNIGQRITALRDSARLLYSFQNPFNDRIVSSSDPSVLSGTSTRQADNQEHYFTVKQIAQTDRFLSQPLDNSFRVDEGTYTFSIGKEEVSFNFRGGSLQEFVDTLNRRGTNKLRASLVAVQPGKKSLLIESRITGAENRLLFSGAAEDFAVRTGILEDGGAAVIAPEPAPVAPLPPPPVAEPVPVELMVREEPLTIDAGGTALIPFDVGSDYSQDGILRFEIATTIHAEELEPASLEQEPSVAEPAEAPAMVQDAVKEAPPVSAESLALSMAATALAESATALSSAAAAITGAVAALTTPSPILNIAPELETESAPLREEAVVEETPPDLASTAPAEEEEKPVSPNHQSVLTIAEDAPPQDKPIVETVPEDAPLLAEEAKEPEPVAEEIPVVTQETQPEPEPMRVDNMNMLSLTFTDGTTGMLPPVEDSTDFKAYQYKVSDIADGKTIASIDVVNLNTHRDLAIRNISFTAQKTEPEPVEPPQPEPAPVLAEPARVSNGVPRTPVSLAQDAIIYMEGIEISRPTNTFDDLLTGITLTVKKPSETPVRFGVEADREMIKDSIIALVGNYNQLVAEINVVTQRNETVINELTYLSEDERADLRKRLGVFSGDSTLTQYKTSLQRAATVSYSTSAEDDLALLSQIGIGTDVRGTTGSGGYDPSRLRGYLEIDEKMLDAALDRDPSAIQQLFGQDTDGDLIVDSGIAYMFETLSRPYTEIGGIITLKTNTIDARISQEQRRIETLDRQLAAKEASLKLQYSQMEDAYNQMEQMTSSLDQFSQQNNNNR